MHTPLRLAALAGLAAALTACGGGDDTPSTTQTNTLPQLAEAKGATISSCTGLATGFTYANATITSATVQAAGAVTVGGHSVAEHCLVNGTMYQRTSAVDGQTYAIGFQMRLPTAWNGRFFYQGNGGLDGSVSNAVGAVSGGGPLTNALDLGFAVISSDAGHSSAQNPTFGIDPQARLDYGYQAVAKLTPMAKALIQAAYGKGPDRSYIGGTSNGGRHVMVAAARMPNDYDGYLAGTPGFNLPKAAVAQLFGAQQYARVATNVNDLNTAFTLAERTTVANAILAKCDALDGASDGMVQDVEACRTAFNLVRDVPTCSGGVRDGSCLTSAQKSVVQSVFAGARNSSGTALYASFPFDPGIVGSDWAGWEFTNSVGARDAVAVGFVFQTPPATTTELDPTSAASMLNFALNFNMDVDAPKIFATSGVYTESAMSFMTPPNPTDLATLRNRGAKMIVFQGTADGVFSPDDTKAWYDGLGTANGGDATNFARFYRVPGMNHSRNGIATDQFDALTALVNWVEKGQAPDRIVAQARGTGNLGGVNSELPSSWSAARTRPLCPYPKVARYKGTGDVESEASFDCRN